MCWWASAGSSSRATSKATSKGRHRDVSKTKSCHPTAGLVQLLRKLLARRSSISKQPWHRRSGDGRKHRRKNPVGRAPRQDHQEKAGVDAYQSACPIVDRTWSIPPISIRHRAHWARAAIRHRQGCPHLHTHHRGPCHLCRSTPREPVEPAGQIEIEHLRAVVRRADNLWGAAIPVIDWQKVLLEEAGEREHVLSDDEEERFWQALRADYHAMVRFALVTGSGLAMSSVSPSGRSTGMPVASSSASSRRGPVVRSITCRSYKPSRRSSRASVATIRFSSSPMSAPATVAAVPSTSTKDSAIHSRRTAGARNGRPHFSGPASRIFGFTICAIRPQLVHCRRTATSRPCSACSAIRISRPPCATPGAMSMMYGPRWKRSKWHNLVASLPFRRREPVKWQ